MAWNMSRNPNPANPPAVSMPVTRAFALVILFMLAVLILLRHLFGSIRVEVGTH